MTNEQIKAKSALMTKITEEAVAQCQKTLIDAAEEMPDTDSRIGIMIVASSILYGAMLHATSEAGKDSPNLGAYARLLLRQYADHIQDGLMEMANAARD